MRLWKKGCLLSMPKMPPLAMPTVSRIGFGLACRGKVLNRRRDLNRRASITRSARGESETAVPLAGLVPPMFGGDAQVNLKLI
jgi:hypothetical protein